MKLPIIGLAVMMPVAAMADCLPPSCYYGHPPGPPTPTTGVIECHKDQGVCYVTTDSTNWHLMTKSYGGTISLIKPPLTKKECEFMMHRARGEPATDEEIARDKEHRKECREYPEKFILDCQLTITMTNPGSIDTAECFQ